jgi:Cof subfamily protein (haloacid dehalogenase superfamily)
MDMAGPESVREAAGRTRSRRGPASTAPIKLIAIDLDGTLLNTSKIIPDRTADALRCVPSDVRVVISSARPPRSVRRFYQSLQLKTWQINYNGALIWDEPAQRTVYHCPMTGDLVRRIIDLSRDMFEEVLVSCEVMDRWHTDRFDETYTTETGKLFKPDVIAPYETFCNQPITKLMLLGEPKILMRLEPLLLEQFGNDVTIVQTDKDLLQIMDRNVSKATALQMTARHYGVSKENIMAIGDAPNDVGMLQLAGVAVAMGNAHPVVKSVAHWIAPSNDEDGVHAALVKFGVCK